MGLYFFIMNPGNSQQALSQLQSAQQAAQNPQDFLSQQQNQLGVQGQRDTVQGLRGAITNTTKLLQQVAPSVMGRTGSSLVTNAQANRQISNEQAPIAQNLSNQNQAYGQASQDLSDLENRAQQAAQLAYTGQQDRIGYLQNLYNTIYQREQGEIARQQAEADRQEQIRQFNESLRRQSSSGGGGGIDLSSLLGGNSNYATSQNKSGGTTFTYKGSPITAAQYANATGANLANILANTRGSEKAYADYSSGKYSSSELIKKYPHIFGVAS